MSRRREGVWGLGFRVEGGERGDGQRPGIAGRIHVHVPVSLPLPGEMRGDATNLSFFLTEGGEELAQSETSFNRSRKLLLPPLFLSSEDEGVSGMIRPAPQPDPQ